MDEHVRAVLFAAARLFTSRPTGWAAYPDMQEPAPGEFGFTLMTEWSGAVEARRLNIRFNRGAAGHTNEDTAQMGMHFINLTGGSPDTTWVDADYAQVETAFDTLWGVMKAKYANFWSLAEYRWYMSGPTWDVTPAPYNPSLRVTVKGTAATGGATATLPPQVAITNTFRTPFRKRWGRWYWPAPLTSECTAAGDLNQTAWHTNVVTFLNACRAGGNLMPIVVSRGHPEYTGKKGQTIPAHIWTGYLIDSCQTDSTFDVIRSRRYSQPVSRSLTALT